ncbi:MAG: alpha/beta hydrolase family protein [Actinoallomurus sp.]
MGAEFAELDVICRPLRTISGTSGAAVDREWLEAWSAGADAVAQAAVADQTRGRRLTASAKWLRAALYDLLGERQTSAKDAESLVVYRRGLQRFRRGISLSDHPVEFVTVPYEGTELRALFVPSEDPANTPCVIHFDGLDVMKELIFLMHADELKERRVSMLICDHPGVGEAIRLQGLHLTSQIEKPAGACLDYLAARGDVPLDRTGIMALSLGGYYAPRAAAFEPRLKFCAVWGAIWDLPACVRHCLSLGTGSVPLLEQFRWVFGLEPGADVDGHLADFVLEPWIHRLTCPIFVLHGEDDRQAPSWTAERTYEAADRSTRRDLMVIPAGEPGSAHCQLDAIGVGVGALHDWVHDVA